MRSIRRTGVDGETSPSSCWVGVDGGGTRSRAVVVDAETREVGRAEGGPSLIDPLRPGEAAGVVAALVREAASAAGRGLPVRGLWAGLAGAGPPGPRAAVRSALEDTGVAAGVVVGGDVEGARADAFGDGPGILLVAGTGSVALARDPSGKRAMVGGWGAALDDEGSGYRIGLDGLRAVMRSADGRDGKTALAKALLEKTGVSDPGGLVEWTARATKRQIASLCVVVGRAFEAGDPAAVRVIEKALEGIRSLLQAALDRTAGWEGCPPVAFVGGLVREGSELRDLVVRVASDLGCDARLAPVVAERGAARLAMRTFPG